MSKLSTEVRLLLAFLLMGVVMIVSNYLNPPQPPPEQTKQAATDAPKAEAPAAAPAAAAPAPAAAAVPGAVQAEAAETIDIETDLFKVTFSNRGATVQHWLLKKFDNNAGNVLELVNQKAMAGGKLPAPLALAFKNTPAGNPNDKLYKVTRGADGLSVEFEYSDGRLSSKKTVQFTKDSYLVNVTSQVVENGVLLPHSLVWRGGFGDATGVNPTADAGSLYYDITDKSLEKQTASDAKDGPVSVSGNYAFAGLEDKYFAAVMLPTGTGTLELTTYSDTVKSADDKDEQHVGAAIGGSGNNALEMYVGPKDADTLTDVEPRLRELIDWGWFWFIAQPLFAGLKWLVATVTHNYGWAIVLLTIIINTALFPLRLTSMKSSRKMQQIQPLVQKINDKYKGVAMNDPRSADKNTELMDLYKAHDINPVGGCLPMLIQIPFFYGLYKALSIAIQLRGAEWLWVADLSQPEMLAGGMRVLPIILVVTQFLSQKMTPSPGMDPTQQKMMMLMPLVFGVMFWQASAGLVLYWLTSNVVSIVQQLLLNRTQAPAVAVVVPPKKKK